MRKKPSKIKQWLRGVAIKTLFPIDETRGWTVIHESNTGYFQMDETIGLSNALAHPTVYACISQIAYDIGKLRLNLTKKDENGLLIPTTDKRIAEILRKPNRYQNRQKFIEYWLVTLLTYGNAYILKARNNSGKVVALYVLDPEKVEPLVSDDGEVFYGLREDKLNGITYDIKAIPAYEIIHDTMITLFHPLIGVSPLYAGNLGIRQGLAIQNHSANFFENKAQPGGILTAPGHIKEATAAAIRAAWQTGYSGDNTGKIAVLGDGLVYSSMGQTAEDSQLVEQLGWSDKQICSVFKVPPYKVHVGEQPTYEQTETLDRKYFSDCLQRQIESIENLLDEGLSIPADHAMQFDLNDLMRMDFKLQMETQAEGVKGGLLKPNEARFKIGYGPVKGGDTPYMQQQNYSLAALAQRDATNPLAVSNNTNESVDEEEAEKWLIQLRLKENIPGVYK